MRVFIKGEEFLVFVDDVFVFDFVVFIVYSVFLFYIFAKEK